MNMGIMKLDGTKCVSNITNTASDVAEQSKGKALKLKRHRKRNDLKLSVFTRTVLVIPKSPNIMPW